MSTMSTPVTLSYFREQACEFLEILGTRGTPKSKVKRLLGGLLHLSLRVEEAEKASETFTFVAREFSARNALMTVHNLWPKE